MLLRWPCRTPSLLLINFAKFNEEAALHEKDLGEAFARQHDCSSYMSKRLLKELDAIEERSQLNRWCLFLEERPV